MCVGIPGQIVAISDERRRLARVEIGGVGREINIACVHDPERPLNALVGEWVLVHVGFAMARISATEAARTLELLEALAEAHPPAAPGNGAAP